MRSRPVVAPLWSLVLAGCSVFGIRSGYEQPPYEVVDRLGDHVEVRRYGPRLAAETTVTAADPEAARNAAFRILAAYIFGANISQSDIAMTAPVEIDAGSEEIAMTAPVEIAADGTARQTMRFFLPARYQLATAPTPTDPRVHLLLAPPETVAVQRFTGSGSAARMSTEQTRLLQALESSRWQPAAAPAALYYDPPWTIPWLRRNEATVAVSPRP
jgi:hypothetical protein